MSKIPIKFKKELGELLAEWYRHFGKVNPRRAYHEDDDEGGSGESKLVFDGHPLFDQLPIGAPSDLSSIIINNQRMLDEADKRADEATPEIQDRLEMVHGKKQRKELLATPKPI